MLLQILSQGSDPLAIQPYYETIFDSIDMVVHDAKDKFIVREFLSRFKVCFNNDHHSINNDYPVLTMIITVLTMTNMVHRARIPLTFQGEY